MNDERKFTDVVGGIEGAEKDVDKVLDAARLARHEGPPRYLSADQKMEIIMALIIVFGVLCIFCLPVVWSWAASF